MGGVEGIAARYVRVEGFDDASGLDCGKVHAHLGVDVERQRHLPLGRERLHLPGRGDAADRKDVEAKDVERAGIEQRAVGPDVRDLVAGSDGIRAATSDLRAALRILRHEGVLEPGERRLAPPRKLSERLLARAPAEAPVHDDARARRKPGSGSLEQAAHRRASGSRAIFSSSNPRDP